MWTMRISLLKYKYIFDWASSSASPSSLLELPIILNGNRVEKRLFYLFLSENGECSTCLEPNGISWRADGWGRQGWWSCTGAAAPKPGGFLQKVKEEKAKEEAQEKPSKPEPKKEAPKEEPQRKHQVITSCQKDDALIFRAAEVPPWVAGEARCLGQKSVSIALLIHALSACNHMFDHVHRLACVGMERLTD